MANKKNRVKITWSDIVNECVRTYEKKQKNKAGDHHYRKHYW